MKPICPKCKKTLFLRINRIIMMSIEEIGVTDVIPGEALDANTSVSMECLECGWNGWTPEYYDELDGIIQLDMRRNLK